MKNLVYIGQIISVKSIENADRLEQIEVVCGKGGKWNAVSQKGNFNIGDLCECYLQDSLLPSDDIRYAFMEKYNWRIRMQRLRGAVSECLCLPLTIKGELGEDITEKLGVLKYEKPIPASLQGQIQGGFPNFLIKTDEKNFQSVPNLVDALQGKSYYSSLKLDGSSATYFNYKGKFGVCSRNLQLKEDDKNSFWKIAKKYNLEESLQDGYAIQGELVGPGIQGNPLGLKEIDIYLFNILNISERKYLNIEEAKSFLPTVKWVPFKTYGGIFNFLSDNELRKYAEVKYDNGKWGEGVVIRPMEEQRESGDRVSFKIINLNYRD